MVQHCRMLRRGLLKDFKLLHVRLGEDAFGANPHELLFLLCHWSRRQAPHRLPLLLLGAVP